MHPNDRRPSLGLTREVSEVLVLAHNDGAVFGGVLPYLDILRLRQPDVENVLALMAFGGEPSAESLR